MPLTRHLPVNDPLVTLRETLVNNPLNNPVFVPLKNTRTRDMSNAECLALLMGDASDPPPQPEENENLLCRFLTSLLAPAGYPSGAGKKASRGLVYYVVN